MSDTEPPVSQASLATVDMDIVRDTTETNIDSSNVPQSSIEVPSTPLGAEMVIPASQDSIVSTEVPGSPMDADSFRTEVNDEDDDLDRRDLTRVVPSSMTPPPSSQVQQHQLQQQQKLQAIQSQRSAAAHTTPLNNNAHTSASQRSAILSPPGTGLTATVAQARREAAAASTTAPRANYHHHHRASASTSSPILAEFIPPSPAQIADATPDDLRTMLQASLAEHTRLKTETAHHKLQYNLLTMQADEDAKRAAVEHEMTRREVEALRLADNARQARRDLSSSNATEMSQAKYRQLKVWYDDVAEENDSLQKRVKLAKKVIQQKEDEVAVLIEEKDLLLNRLRENREHFHLLCSPGGIFHGAMTPKPQGSPAQSRATPYHTPKRGSNGGKLGATTTAPSAHRGGEPFAALLQALDHENNSAPNTPLVGGRAPPRHLQKHTRNVQSMSSLPTTPNSRPRAGEFALLPSIDLVPQTEPPPPRFGGPSGNGNGHHRGHGHSQSMSMSISQAGAFLSSASGRFYPETPTRGRHRLPGHATIHERAPPTMNAPVGGATSHRSRESTISMEDANGSGSGGDATKGAPVTSANLGANEDLARQALESVAQRASVAHQNSTSSFSSSSTSRRTGDEQVFESQASQAASAMLRRDARESFEIAAANKEKDASAAKESAEKAGKMQARLYGGVHKVGAGPTAGGVDKRKFSGHGHGHGHGHSQSVDGSIYSNSHGYSRHHVLGAETHDQHSHASPTKKVRIVPSLRDDGDSYRHHHSYLQQQQQQGQQPPQAQQSQQDRDRVGLGISFD